MQGLGKIRMPLVEFIISAVQGDIHDIGKNIVVTMAKAAGFEAIDLSVDVAPERFIEAIKKM